VLIDPFEKQLDLPATSIELSGGHGWHDKVAGQEVQELGEESATFVQKVENRRNAKNHPQRTAAELKLKIEQTAKMC